MGKAKVKVVSLAEYIGKVTDDNIDDKNLRRIKAIELIFNECGPENYVCETECKGERYYIFKKE